MLYGVEIYASTFDTYLDRLRKLNNKILRIMQTNPNVLMFLIYIKTIICCL